MQKGSKGGWFLDLQSTQNNGHAFFWDRGHGFGYFGGPGWSLLFSTTVSLDTWIRATPKAAASLSKSYMPFCCYRWHLEPCLNSIMQAAQPGESVPERFGDVAVSMNWGSVFVGACSKSRTIMDLHWGP